MNTIQTERLILRAWEEKDIEPLAQLYADPLVMEFWEIHTPEQSLKEYHHFVSSMKKHGYGFWAVELKENHQFIGLIGLADFEFQAILSPAVEIGWRLASNYWGHGYATEGAQAALQFGFETLNLPEIVSFTAMANQRSRHIMEKLGMSYSPEDDFNDPDLPEGHPHRRLVLYRLTQQDWQKR